jgi:Membrane proteins related to metalloendopeptidases
MATYLLRASLVLGIALAMRRFARHGVAPRFRYLYLFVAACSLPLLSVLPPLRESAGCGLPSIARGAGGEWRAGETVVLFAATMPSLSATSIRIPSIVADAVLCLWAIGALVSILRCFFSRAAALRAAMSLPPSEDRGWAEALVEAMRLSGRDSVVSVREGGVQAPVVVGILSPVIVVPADGAKWTVDRRRAAMMHEIGHIVRGDTVTMAIAELILASAWCVPFVALALRRMSEDREEACDEIAVSRGTCRSEYASLLIELAPKANSRSASALHMIAGRSDVEQRIRDLLEGFPARKLKQGSWAFAWSLALAAAIAASMLFSPALFAEAGSGKRLELRTIGEDGVVCTRTYLAKELPLGSPLVGKWRITQDFGTSIEPFSGLAWDHTGIDLANGSCGNLVRASMGGVVRKAGRISDSGLYAVIAEGATESVYEHLESLKVSEGNRVYPGDVIGSVGDTGRSTGPHLHYEIRVHGLAVDPAPVLALLGSELSAR